MPTAARMPPPPNSAEVSDAEVGEYVNLETGSVEARRIPLLIEGVGTFFLAIALFSTSGLTSGRPFGGFDDDLAVGGIVVGGMLALLTTVSRGRFHGNPAISVSCLTSEMDMSAICLKPSPKSLLAFAKLAGAQLAGATLAHVLFNTVLGGSAPELPTPGGTGQYHWASHIGTSAANELLLVLQLVATYFATADGAYRGLAYAVGLAAFGYRGQAIGNPAISLGIAIGSGLPLIGSGGGAGLGVIVMRTLVPLLAGLAGGALSNFVKEEGAKHQLSV